MVDTILKEKDIYIYIYMCVCVCVCVCVWIIKYVLNNSFLSVIWHILKNGNEINS